MAFSVGVTSHPFQLFFSLLFPPFLLFPLRGPCAPVPQSVLYYPQDNRNPIEEIQHSYIFSILIKQYPVLGAPNDADKL